jgi:hypothetical protein
MDSRCVHDYRGQLFKPDADTTGLLLQDKHYRLFHAKSSGLLYEPRTYRLYAGGTQVHYIKNRLTLRRRLLIFRKQWIQTEGDFGMFDCGVGYCSDAGEGAQEIIMLTSPF